MSVAICGHSSFGSTWALGADRGIGLMQKGPAVCEKKRKRGADTARARRWPHFSNRTFISNGSEKPCPTATVQVVDVFGLRYAAGRFAKDKGYVPERWSVSHTAANLLTPVLPGWAPE